MSMVAKLKGFRKWTVDEGGGSSSLTARYIAVRDEDPVCEMSLEDLVVSITGLPPIGAAVSEDFPNLIVRTYAIEEGEANEKRVLTIDVNCSLRDPQNWDVSQFPPRGQAIQELSFTSGSVSRDLVQDAITGKLVLNSAGQPFDSVPQIDVPSPTFRKVIKVKSAQTWAQYQGKVNAAAITVGGFSCAPHVVRCVQADRVKLWNDEFGFVEQWTIGLQLMSNWARIDNSETATQIGWDLAIVDQGTMALHAVFGEGEQYRLGPVMTISAETGKEVAVSQPVLLDGLGFARLEQGAKPYTFRVAPYPETTFPVEFYSET